MGTPEFPDLGRHCSVDDCKQIDFLPFTCDRCKKIFCLEHRGYARHFCPNANEEDVTVVICPLCAKGVRLIPKEDPNITWETHVNTDCDPSNYQRVNKKRRCPAPRCRETLVFSNTIRCRDCQIDHCLKHRFGPDHNCPGPKKPEIGLSFRDLFIGNKKEGPGASQKQHGSSWWSNVWNSAEASMSKLSTAAGKQIQKAKDGMKDSTPSGPLVEQCVQCSARFSSAVALVEHVEKAHQHGSKVSHSAKVTIDACPKCSKGFIDPVALVEHVEKEHGGTSYPKR